jgi:hypothetical protein
MKKALALLFIFVSTASYADEICGLLQTQAVAPVCNPGEACPAFMRLVYTVTPANGTAVTVTAQSLDVLNDFESALNTNVCVEGTSANDGFEVASIKTQ